MCSDKKQSTLNTGKAQLVYNSQWRVNCCVRCSNDVFDAETGVDEKKDESVVNLTGGNRSGVLALANACLLAGAWLLHAGTKAAVRNPWPWGINCRVGASTRA